MRIRPTTWVASFLLLTLVVPPAFASPAATGTEATTETTWWAIDAQHMELRFAVRHLDISTLGGAFRDVQGVLRLDEADVTRSSVDVAIDVDSIDTGIVNRDGHLLSEDFLDGDAFSSITFRSTRVERGPKDTLLVTGDLTLRGATRPITLVVQGPTGPVEDPWGNERRGVHATATLDRTDYGVSWEGKTKDGGEMLGREVSITIDLELVRRSEEEARAVLAPEEDAD